MVSLSDFSAWYELQQNRNLLCKDASNLTPAALVDLLYCSRWERFFLIKQIKYETIALLKAVSDIHPRIVVEVGSPRSLPPMLAYFQ